MWGGNTELKVSNYIKFNNDVDFTDFYKKNKINILNIPIFMITKITNYDDYISLSIEHLFDKQTTFTNIDSRYVSKYDLTPEDIFDYRLIYMLNNISIESILNENIKIILIDLEKYTDRQSLFIEYFNIMSKIVSKIIQNAKITQILNICAFSRSILENIFIKNGIFKESAVLDMDNANKFGRVKNKQNGNIGMLLDDSERDLYETGFYDITPLRNYNSILPKIKTKYDSNNPSYGYDFEKCIDFQYTLTKNNENERTKYVGFKVYNNNYDFVLNKFYYERNENLIELATQKNTTYYFNLGISGKTHLADERYFRCIEHPNIEIYDTILNIIDEHYNITIDKTREQYDRIISAIKIFYWLSTTVFYARGSATIAEIVTNGLLKYILNNDDFVMQKKTNTFPDIEAMLEPDDDYFVYVFLTVFDFSDSSLDSFREKYIQDRNEFCNQYNDKLNRLN
jgi:hypothetical protein